MKRCLLDPLYTKEPRGDNRLKLKSVKALQEKGSFGPKLRGYLEVDG
jgi:hypothetical protein